MVHPLRRIFGVFFVVAFVVFLVTSNVRWAFNTLLLYEFGFSRHQVSRDTGLTPEQLSEAARQIRDYFNSSEEELDVRITVDGTSRKLYSERETQHMRDVKDLLWKVYRVQEGMFLYLFLFATLGFLVMGNDFAAELRLLLVRGSALTVTSVGLVAVASMVGFGPLFELFHRLSFSNDLWQLDPYTSYLVRMFPQGFWLEGALLIAIASAIEAVGVVVLLTVVRWWQLWRRHVAQSKAPQFV